MKTRKVTLQSISEELGISKTTVSLVLKGDGDKYRISRKTQARILNHAEKSGFKPDFLARALATKRTATIGIIFPDLHEAFMSEMLRGIESVLYESEYSFMLSTSGFDEGIEERNIRQMLHRKVDGIIIVPYVPIGIGNCSRSYTEYTGGAGTPAVFVDRLPKDHEGLDWVVQDDFDASAAAVQRLAERGCRKIGCISFNLGTSSIINRLEGFRAGLERCGLNHYDGNMMLLDSQNPDAGDLESLVMERIAERGDFDGLLVTTGGLAHKAGYLLSGLGLQNPPVIAKFGRDPDYFNTGMIQVIQPNVEMGRTAAGLLLDRIKNPDAAPVHSTIKSRIIDKDG